LNVVSSEIEGTLTVAATYTVIGYFLPLHIERLRRLFPKLEIQLFELNRESIEEGVVEQPLRHVGAAHLQHPQSGAGQGEGAELDAPALAARPAPPAPGRNGRASGNRRRALHHADGDEAAHSALKYWSASPYQPRVILRTSSVEATRSLVANGQGVAILSDMVHRPWSLEGRRIETVNISDPVPAMDVGLAWRRNMELSPPMLAFRSYFQQAFHLPER
jgi:DNA-binding transcriptional LysR family regulator